MIVCNGLKLQLLLGDPQATTTGCWKIEEYLGCHGSPHLPDAGVLLGLAHPPSDQLLGYLPEYPGSEPPQPLLGFLHCCGLGFWLAFSYSFCFILKNFFWAQHDLPSPCVHLEAGASSFPLVPLGCSNDSRTVFPGHLEGERSSPTGSASAASETFKQGWE